jgi:hypothetical protein
MNTILQYLLYLKELLLFVCFGRETLVELAVHEAVKAMPQAQLFGR